MVALNIADDRAQARIRHLAEIAPGLPGAGRAWLAALRQGAIDRFAATGFPTTRIEAWHYTDLRRLLRNDFAPPGAAGREATLSGAALAPWRIEGARHLAVLLDGRLVPALSELSGLPAGAALVSLAAALADDDGAAALAPHLGRIASLAPEGAGLAALNTAFMADGAVLTLAPGTVLESPVQILHLMSAGAAAELHPRTLVVAGEGSRACVVETFAALGPARGWTNAVTEIALGPEAAVEHVKLQAESAGAWHIGLSAVRLGREAAYSGFVFSTGGRLARNETRVRIEGEGADCRLAGVVLLRGRQHCDTTTDVAHASGGSHSRQHFKGAVDERARSVFQGRILVAPDAQRTDAHQLNRNLLLSPEARADSKPELVIHADDVKCSHGATVGDLDRDALFYLRARGIDAATARALLIEAFVREPLEMVAAAAVRARLEEALAAWLGRSAEARAAA